MPALVGSPVGAVSPLGGVVLGEVGGGTTVVGGGTVPVGIGGAVTPALSAAGVPFPGHTEMLQAAAGGAPVRMMLANEQLRVVLVTIHVALRRAIEMLDVDGVLQTVRIAHRAAAAWGQAAPPTRATNPA